MAICRAETPFSVREIACDRQPRGGGCLGLDRGVHRWTAALVVPPITIFEVYKWVLREHGRPGCTPRHWSEAADRPSQRRGRGGNDPARARTGARSHGPTPRIGCLPFRHIAPDLQGQRSRPWVARLLAPRLRRRLEQFPAVALQIAAGQPSLHLDLEAAAGSRNGISWPDPLRAQARPARDR